MVEDSAEAHGVRPVGDIACFSLFANKIITSGEGGICLTDDSLAGRPDGAPARAGRAASTAYLHRQARLQLPHDQPAGERRAGPGGDGWTRSSAKRTDLEKRYEAGLDGVPGLTLMPQRDVLWMYDLLAEQREELAGYLAARASRPGCSSSR